MGEMKQKRSTLIHVSYNNDRQLKLIRDTMEQFGMEFEVLENKESYDNKIRLSTKIKQINPVNEMARFMAFGAAIILVLVLLSMMVASCGIDPQQAYK